MINKWNDDANEGNLGRRERSNRLTMGLVALALGWSVAFTFRPLSVVGHLSMFVMFWLAGLGIFQGKEKT
jgi:hypothetical protein